MCVCVHERVCACGGVVCVVECVRGGVCAWWSVRGGVYVVESACVREL